jgi:hypothetical protein
MEPLMKSEKIIAEKSTLTRPQPHEWLVPIRGRLFGVLKLGLKEYIVEKIMAVAYTLTQFDGAKKITYTLILDVHCSCDGFRNLRHCKHMEIFNDMKRIHEI